MVRGWGWNASREEGEGEQEEKYWKIESFIFFVLASSTIPNSCLGPQFIESNGDERPNNETESDMMCGFAEVTGLVNSFPEGLKREGEWEGCVQPICASTAKLTGNHS